MVTVETLYAYSVPKDRLREFVAESNRIEGIKREPSDAEIEATWRFLTIVAPSPAHLCDYVRVIADAAIRNCGGMDVRVGSHCPPPGGTGIPIELDKLFAEALRNEFTPFEIHRRYETLHPFMDGNGRSGRVLWAWQMIHHDISPMLSLKFLHAWYKQSLSAPSVR